MVVARRATAALQNALVRIEEQVRHPDRLVAQTAGVRPQVEDQRAHPLRHQTAHFLLELVGRVLPNHGHAEIADPVGEQHARRHGPLVDALAEQVEPERVRDAFTAHGQVDRAADRAAHRFHRLIEGPVGRRLAVDLDQLISGPDPRPLGGTSLHRGDDRHPSVPGVHQEADAGVVTGRALHVALPVLAHQQRGIGIVQLTQQPVHGPAVQLRFRQRVDVVIANVGEDGLEQPGLLVHVAVGGDLALEEPAAGEAGRQGDHPWHDQTMPHGRTSVRILPVRMRREESFGYSPLSRSASATRSASSGGNPACRARRRASAPSIR